MKEKNIIETAYDIAAKAHEGQVDKAGNDYIYHPVTVAESLETDDEKAVALLHDVIEDTDVTAEDLRQEGMPEKIVAAVQAMTHKEGEDYFAYIRRVKQNPLAKKVKLQDLRHNSDINRIHDPTDKDYERIKKYEKAKEILLEV